MAALRRRWLQVGDQRLYARIGDPARPSGAPVLLVAGLTMSGRYLAPTAAELATDRLVLAPDLPGVGRSPHPERPLTIVELADLLHDLLVGTTGPAVIVANSFGCQVAVELALRHPAVVRGLVLTSPVVAPRVRSLAPVSARFLAAMAHEPWAYLGIALLDNVRGWTRKGRSNLLALLAYPIEDRVAELTVPTLVVRGSRDRLVPEPFARRLAGLVPGGRSVEMATGHAVPYSAPVALARLVRGVGSGAP